jgi:hypothetical protein
MRAYQTITSNTCPNINAQMLLLSGLGYTMKIVNCPLVVVLKIYDAVSTKTCLT